MSAPQEVAWFLIERLRQFHPHKWQQARRVRPLVDASLPAELSLFNDYSLFRVPDDACLGLLHWSLGHYRGQLSSALVDWRDILKAQASGRRPVALLSQVPREAEAVAGIPRKYFENDLPLAFALHDLRHLHKFFEPAHHEGQRAFFSSLDEALLRPEWKAATHGASDTFWHEIRRIASDMNGAAPFLCMALKAAVRNEFQDTAEARFRQFPQGLVECVLTHASMSRRTVDSGTAPLDNRRS